VMLCQPVAMKAKSFRMLRKIKRVVERVSGRAPGEDRRKVQDREWNHRLWVAAPDR
jgi:hypothetical protein